MCNHEKFYNILVNFEVIVTKVLPKYAEWNGKFNLLWVHHSYEWEIYSQLNDVNFNTYPNPQFQREDVHVHLIAGKILKSLRCCLWQRKILFLPSPMFCKASKALPEIKKQHILKYPVILQDKVVWRYKNDKILLVFENLKLFYWYIKFCLQSIIFIKDRQHFSLLKLGE